MAADQTQDTTVINAVIFTEQKEALEQLAREWSSFSVSQVLRVLLAQSPEMQAIQARRNEQTAATMN